MATKRNATLRESGRVKRACTRDIRSFWAPSTIQDVRRAIVSTVNRTGVNEDYGRLTLVISVPIEDAADENEFPQYPTYLDHVDEGDDGNSSISVQTDADSVATSPYSADTPPTDLTDNEIGQRKIRLSGDHKHVTSSTRPTSPQDSAHTLVDDEDPMDLIVVNTSEPKQSPVARSSRGRPLRKSRITSYFASSDDDFIEEREAQRILPRRSTAQSKAKNSSARPRRRRSDDDESDFALDAESVSEEDDFASDSIQSSDGDEAVSDSDVSGDLDEKSGRQSTKKPAARGQSQTSNTADGPKPLISVKDNAKDRMTNLTKGGLRGLDYSLPPMNDISTIFQDMTKKALALGLEGAIPRWQARPLRVATMCSGTESPLLAIQMIQSVLKSKPSHSFDVIHLFSAEIVPYKQAYIERNFSVPVIFRDITELTNSSDENVCATTAYGALLPVPGRLDLLIAGTACVDYSMLNHYKKTMDDNGESGDTFRAVHTYAKRLRPTLVILENVFTAPWNQMLQSYEDIDYAAAGVLVDTKNFYLPQTRQRGYMFCTDRSAYSDTNGADKAAKKWIKVMEGLRRPASSPASDFMLASDDPTVLRSRALLARRSLLDDSAREVDWSKSAIRHIQYRRETVIGNARPYTSWQASGSVSLPDYADHDWFRQQVERIWDVLDCSYLRKALPKSGSIDIEYKTRIINVSQNVDRNPDSTPAGISPCITPSGIFFVTHRGALLSPDESIALQGLPLDKISFTTETSRQIQDLAGNAMSSTVVGAAILAALSAGVPFADAPDDCVAARRDLARSLHVEPRRPAQIVQTLVENVAPELDLARLRAEASASSQRCACEGPYDRAKKAIQICQDCGHSSCIACGGKPSHNYGTEHVLRHQRLDPSAFIRDWQSKLPTHIQFEVADGLLDDMEGRVAAPHTAEFAKAVQLALGSAFRLARIRRGLKWRVEYVSDSGSLDIIIRADRLDWRLFAMPDPSWPSNSPSRRLLKEPVAIGSGDNDSHLLDVRWQWRNPNTRVAQHSCHASEQRTASWLARLNIPGAEDQTVPTMITIPASGVENVIDISGDYQYLPRCGTASECLYKRMDQGQHSLYIMLDVDPVGDAEEDRCIITDNPHRLVQGEMRNIYARFPKKWRPWSAKSGRQQISLEFDHDLSPCEGLTLESAQPALSLECLDKESFVLPVDQDCSYPTVILAAEIPKFIDAGGEAAPRDLDWVFTAARPHLRLSDETELTVVESHLTCESCMPTCSPIRWKWSADRRSLKPYEDPATATRFEELLKQRPDIVTCAVKNTDANSRLTVSVNLCSLLHRAAGKLHLLLNGVPANPTFTWKIDTSYHEASTAVLPGFSLRNNDQDFQCPQHSELQITLWPKQRRALSWMMKQEQGDGAAYSVEEVEETMVKGANWRIQMTARQALAVRGGIQASHPGFGKTICTLALIETDFNSASADDVISMMLPEVKAAVFSPVRLAATLIVAPKHLVQQWASEVDKVLGKDYVHKTITIASVADLNKHDVANFRRARIIIINQDVLTHEAYVKRLATFVGLPEPSAVKGRQYAAWLATANGRLFEHVDILQTKGAPALRNTIKQVYKSHGEDAAFLSIVPSKRLKGKQYANKRKSQQLLDDDGDVAAPALPALDSKDLALVDKPLFEMFHFNRVVVDEFTYLTAKDFVAIENLRADKRWALSATAKLQDPYDIAKMADLIGVRLRVGENAPGALSARNLKKLMEEKTEFEQFQTFRTAPSMAVTQRTYELAQVFLDSFVRQNILEFDDFPYKDHLLPVNLTVTHRLVYTELSQHLNGADMRIKKSRKSGVKDRDRDLQIFENLQDVDSAEEALLRLAAFFNNGKDTNTLSALASKRRLQAEQARKGLEQAIAVVLAADKNGKDPVLKSWREDVLEGKSLGDNDATMMMKSLFQQSKSLPKTTSSKRKTGSSLSDELSVMNDLAKHYVATMRSIRFVDNAQAMFESIKEGQHCDVGNCSASKSSMNVSSVCGHTICDTCWAQAQASTGLCSASGCNVPIFTYHLLKDGKLAQAQPESIEHAYNGFKITAVVDRLEVIKQAGEQAIIFVRYEDQIDILASVCKASGIRCTAVKDIPSAASLITQFQDERDSRTWSTVIILNASNASAAGVNLTNANHVLFLSPLLTDTQYDYDAAMAQAIGRVRRPGQTKQIHVYRFVALDTIDVDILEHRERRDTAISELGAAEVIGSDGKIEQHEGRSQRMQLIKDKAGAFHLMPKRWLLGENADWGCGIEGRFRVGGYEDFSSLVKFSKAYSEDD